MYNRGAHSIRNWEQLRKPFSLIVILSIILGFFQPAGAVQAAASLTVTPITWNMVGLDSNNVNVGPNNFPVGARVCNTGDSPASNVSSSFEWDSTDAYISSRPGSITSYDGALAVDSLAAGSCVDFYYEISITRNSAAYNHTRRYHLTASSDETGPLSTPTPREIYVEHLVSQNRNSVTEVRLDGVPISTGGTLALLVGNTYDIQLVGNTSTNGYNELESFISLPNTIFRINSVTSTYTVTSLAPPHDLLYADSCGWDNNPLSPTYRSCIGSDGKSGGNVTTNYNVTVISGSGTNQSLNTLIYDFSGSSFHYNSDFSSSARFVAISSALNFAKAFSPSSISAGGTSTLTFTLTNPTSIAANGVSFSDDLPATPAQMTVATTPNASAVGCGSPSLTATAGTTSVSIANASVAANSTCTFSVDVSASADGIYANTSGSLSINSVDTGETASANLTVAATQTGTGLACTNRDLATWTMEGSGVTAPPAYTTKESDVSTAVTSFHPAAGGGQLIDTANGNPGSSWAGYGWDKTGTPSIDSATYFQIAIDTSQYSSVGISLDARANTNWGPNGNNMFVYSSTTGADGSFTQTGSTVAVSKDGWPASPYTFTAAATGSASTYFRISAVGANNTGSNATLMLDNIQVSGCGQPLQPVLTKAFSPAQIAAGDTTTLTFTLANGNGADLTEASFTDPLPTGLVVAATPAASNTCGATFSPNSGDTSLTLSGGTIPAGGNCTASVDVTAASAGAYENVSGRIDTLELGTNSGDNGVASATLNVLSAPGFSKKFSPNPIYAGETSTLVFTLSNPNDVPLSGAAFSDALPGGLEVAATPAASSTCSGATFAPGAGATSLSFSDGVIPANGSCTAQVDVTAASTGDYANTSSSLSTSVSGLTAGAASDTLAVISHYPGLKLGKQVAPDSTGPWTSFLTLAPGSDVYYRLTVENIGDVDLSAVVLSDPTLDLSSCPLSTAFTLTVADPTTSCTIGPLSAQTGDALNTATARGVYNDAVYTSTAMAEYLGVNLASGPSLTLIKQVSTAQTGPWNSAINSVNSGANLYYRFTMMNSGDTTLNGLGLNDLTLDTSSCEWIDPLSSGGASTCIVGPVTAVTGTNTNTATASSTSPLISSSPANATYTSGDYGISGTVWQDDSRDGVIDSGETSLFNVTLDLYRDTGDETFDAGTDTYLGSQYSDVNGNYAFSNLLGGIYFIDLTGGVSGYLAVSGGANPRQITLSGDSSNNNFGYDLPQVDLGVTNSDGVASVTAGDPTTYTIRVTNNGDVSVTGATLSDTLGSGLQGSGVTCSSASSNRCSTAPLLTSLTSGGISLPALAPGEFYEIRLTANVIAASGSVTNTATIAPPVGTTDVNSANDSRADIDTVTPSELPSNDLAVTITNGVSSVISGSTTTYTIRATNNGPATVLAAILTNVLGTGLTANSVACSSASGNQCSGTPGLAALAGSGLSLPSLTSGQFYEINLLVQVDATSGSVTSTATVAPPAGTTDSNVDNNTQADSDPVSLSANLSISKTNSTSAVTAGGSTTYIIRVTNAGPSAVSGATLLDAGLSGLTASSAACSSASGNQCSGTPGLAALTGSGLSLPNLDANEFYEISLTAHVDAASGSVSNTATVTPPSGVTDPVTTNDAATDTDSVTPVSAPSADLQMSVTDQMTAVDAGGSTTYTIRATNNGPTAVSAAILTSTPGAGLTANTLSCSSTSGNQCSGAPSLAALTGSGLSLPGLTSGQFYEVRLAADVTASTGSVTTTAAIAVPAGINDPDTSNNTASDTNTVTAAPAHYSLFLPDILQTRWPVTTDWQLGLGYEDLRLNSGLNDYDYNDWNVAIDGSVTYVSATEQRMQQLDMSFTPRARGASYDHTFQIVIPAATFASNGTATLTLYDQNHQVISVQQTAFLGSVETTFVIFPRTSEALPGSIVNVVEGRTAVLPQRFAELSIVFDTPFAFTVDQSDLNMPHGEGLFFDPLLDVIDTHDQVHRADMRLLSVPSTTWLWPEETVRLDRAYPLVGYTAGNPPTFTFPEQWWTQSNHCVYDGTACGLP